MMNIIRIRWNQFIEEARDKSPKEALRKAVSMCVHLNRVVVPVFNDLSAVKQAGKPEDTASLQFLIVDKWNVDSLAGLNQTTSRRLKGAYNTESGYYAYAVLSGGKIVGDIWCATPKNVKRAPIHPDLGWLDINCCENEAYMFDMYVSPDSRGKVITTYLLANALNDLKQNGFDRVYGFYEKSNLPALWTHRLFGYTELPNRNISKILLYSKSEAVTPVASSSPAKK